MLDGSSPPVTFNGDINLDYGNSNDDVNMDYDLTINGNFNISSTGANNTLTVPAGSDILVNGNMGDPDNNNIEYITNGTVYVRDTLFGKNSNGFSGSGSMGGGTIDMGNGASCDDPCPIDGGFENCSGSPAFCGLPVELLFFRSRIENEIISIEWATFLETNFSHFEIEKSSDGNKYGLQGGVDGAGESTEIVNYSYVDLNPILGVNYYRLKAVDLDETYEYFGPLSVEFFGEVSIRVFPNPVTNHSFMLDLNFDPEKNTYLNIVDLSGRTIFQQQLTFSSNHISLPQHLSPGSYFASVMKKGKKIVRRLIII